METTTTVLGMIAPALTHPQFVSAPLTVTTRINSGILMLVTAFHEAAITILLIPLLGRGAHSLGGTGPTTTGAASLLTLAILLRNAPLGGHGIMVATAANR